MRVDLHVHAMELSACAVAGEVEMIQAAIDCGLDAIALTNHDRFVPSQRLEDLNRRFAPFRIFPGIEISVTDDEHIIVLGVQNSDLQTFCWSYAELHAFVRRRNGLLILAHPYRYRDIIAAPVEEYPPDAVELHSVNTGADDEEAIRALAKRLGCRLICNSDAHAPQEVGAYHSRLNRPATTEAELLEILRTGAYECADLADRVADINHQVDAREQEIRQLIDTGHDRHAYRHRTGHWEGYFDRVARGKSYRI